MELMQNGSPYRGSFPDSFLKRRWWLRPVCWLPFIGHALVETKDTLTNDTKFCKRCGSEFYCCNSEEHSVAFLFIDSNSWPDDNPELEKWIESRKAWHY